MTNANTRRIKIHVVMKVSMFFSLVMMFFGALTSVKAQDTVTMNLKECMRYAVEHSTQMRVQQADNRDAQIDFALRQWSKQVGQYAINVTDYAVFQAFEDAGIEEVEWVTEHDQRVCSLCHKMDGKRYRIDEVPSKPHVNCRCTVIPIFDKES